MDIFQFITLISAAVVCLAWFAAIEFRLWRLQYALTEYLRAQRTNDGQHSRQLQLHIKRIQQLERFLEKNDGYHIREN